MKMKAIIVSQDFLNQQLGRAQNAAHILTSMEAMSKRDTLALQHLADLCRALRNPLLEDPAPVDQQRLVPKQLFENEMHNVGS